MFRDPMPNYVLTGGQVYTGRRFLPNESLGLVDGRLDFSTEEDGLSRYEGRMRVLRANEISAEGKLIVPGYIDSHCHGGGGADGMKGTMKAIRTMADAYAQHGTTGLVVATVGATDDELGEVLYAIGRVSGEKASSVLGSLVEGTYISPEMAGAQNPDFMRDCDPAHLRKLFCASDSTVRIVAVAPEREGALDLIGYAAEKGIVAALGHTKATYEQGLAAVERGATRSIHTYNRQSPFAHRDVGIVGLAMRDYRLIAELISDGIHICPEAIRTLVEMKNLHSGRYGVPNMCLITDGMPPAAFDGQVNFEIAGRPVYQVETPKGRALYMEPEGKTLAGSCLTMDRAVQHMRSIGLPLEEILPMTSEMPAWNLGIYGETGSIEPRKRADVLLLNPDTLDVEHVFVGGRMVK